MEVEISYILSVPQLRLCLDVLGCDEWDDLPMIDTQEPVEQRLMNAFLSMIQAGLFLPGEAGYQMEPVLAKKLQDIGQADKVWYLLAGGQILALLYSKDSHLAAVYPDEGKPEYCIVAFYEQTSVEALSAEIAAMFDGSDGAQLLEADALPRDRESLMEKMALFYGVTPEKEEAK